MTTTKVNKQSAGPGPGRPRVSDKLGAPMWVRLYPAHDQELRELARDETREPSNMARRLIEEALAARRQAKGEEGAA